MPLRIPKTPTYDLTKKRSSLPIYTGETVDPKSKMTVLEIEGNGYLDGLNLEWHNVSHENLKLWITIDGEQTYIYGSWFAGALGFIDDPPVNTNSKPWTICRWDTTNNWYSISFTSPLFFSEKIKIEIENTNDTNSLNFGLGTMVVKVRD